MKKSRGGKKYLRFLLILVLLVFIVAKGKAIWKQENENYETVTVGMPAYHDVEDCEMVQNAINKITEKRYGIHFVFRLMDSANWKQKTEVMLLNRDIDILVLYGKPLYEYVQDGQIVDLTHFMEEASETMQNVWTREELRGTSINGKLYGLPTFRNFGNYIGLNIDENTAEEFGIEEGQRLTMEEVDAFLRAAKKKYPDRDIMVPQGVDTLITEWTWDGLGDMKNVGVLPDCGQTLTVQNLYETDDFIEFCTWTRSWYQDGLIMEDILSNSEQWQELIGEKRGICCFDNYGVNQIEGMVRTILVDKWSVSNSYGIMSYVISANSSHPWTAWKGMEILYTDSDVEILLNNGIEDLHYIRNEDGTISFPEGKNAFTNGYGMAEAYWVTPYSRYAYPLQSNGADFAERMEAFNRETLKSKAIGFIFDPSPVEEQYSACCMIYDKYTKALMSGTLDLQPTLEQANKELDEAGLKAVILEKQNQLNQYLEMSQKAK